MVAMLVYDGLAAIRKGASKSLPKEEAPPDFSASPSAEWEALCVRVNQIVGEIISQFPPDIALEARQVPCLFREWAEPDAKGYLRLGEYHNFVPGRKSDHLGPIVFFLKAIEQTCAESGEDFDAKIRYVYLHELGHHFGWDEVDLVRHGLPSGKPPGE